MLIASFHSSSLSFAAHNANRFAIFTLAYADSFEAALQALEQITLPAAGSLEDALQFFDADIALWRDTDGALEWVRNTTSRLQLMPPTRAEATAAISSTSSLDHHFTTYVQSTESSSSVTRGQVDAHAMFVGMYFTALEMAHE